MTDYWTEDGLPGAMVFGPVRNQPETDTDSTILARIFDLCQKRGYGCAPGEDAEDAVRNLITAFDLMKYQREREGRDRA